MRGVKEEKGGERNDFGEMIEENAPGNFQGERRMEEYEREVENKLTTGRKTHVIIIHGLSPLKVFLEDRGA